MDYNYGYDSSNVLEELLGGGLALGGMAVSFGIMIVSAIICLVIALAFQYVEAIPTFKIAKKNGVDHAWIALIPILPCRLYILSKIAGDKEISFFGKVTIKNRLVAFLIWLGVYLIGVPLMTFIAGLIGGVLGLIPVIGIILAALVGFVLGLVPAAVTWLIEYSFLRDVLDIYKEDKHSNNTTSIVISVLSCFFTRLVRGIYLWTLIKKEPLYSTATYEE